VGVDHGGAHVRLGPSAPLFPPPSSCWMLVLLADGSSRSISRRIECWLPSPPRCALYTWAGPPGFMICYAPNYWKWLPEILRNGHSKDLAQTIWIKWLRGCISFSPAAIPHPWYTRHRIIGPAPFRLTIANSVHGPQFLAPSGRSLPMRFGKGKMALGTYALYGVTRCKSYCKGPFAPKCMK
jgi:hypothetical protein